MSERFTSESLSQFTELFDLNEIQKLQDLFSAATGVASIITEPDGTSITAPSGFCDLCKEIRNTEKGLYNCQKSDSVIGSPREDGPNIQRCLSAGLLDGGASIIVNGVHIADWLIGQVLEEDSKITDLLKYADELNIDRDIYRNKLAKVKRMSKQQFENVCDYLYLNAQLLSKYAVKNISLVQEINSKIKNEVTIKNLNIELEVEIKKRTDELIMTTN
ncbi:putative histidine kinase sensor domain protein [Desulfosporosinus acididurans]|uniref:Putative histidine kinase sensor domain protein n=1 Tax=Desulfosporosinus acididurans TaxID=476652 RepID=A0A0J1FKV4_9FIRM|nr:putative histidine kinase sensor domain protein [Desulfosporosinus acididurans]